MGSHHEHTIDDITLTGGLAGCIFYPVCDFPPRGSLKQGTTIYGLRNLKNLSLGRINYGILYIIHIISPNQIIRSIRCICLPIKLLNRKSSCQSSPRASLIFFTGRLYMALQSILSILIILIYFNCVVYRVITPPCGNSVFSSQMDLSCWTREMIFEYNLVPDCGICKHTL